MSTPPAPDLATLNRDLARLETDAAQLEIHRRAARRTARRAGRYARYLRLARWFRRPTTQFPHFALVVFAVGPLTVGALTLVLLSLAVGNWSVALGGFLIATIAGAACFAALLYYPSDDILEAALTKASEQFAAEMTRLSDLTAQRAVVRERLEALLLERRHLAASDKLQRAMLLQRNWKAMRGAEWEDYIVEVCRTLGANVQRGATVPPPSPETSGPRGVVRHAFTPLFVTFSPRRFAVAAVSEIRPFHTAAVQQLAAELASQGCDALAIITNARVTTGSRELARSRHCTLIGEDEFPDFVLGKITL